ncbi:MAG: hypothetical protein R3240_14005, partial [Gammaproteobacteria bacterium]|nr:hypothetical protein [Gammaproteobacteria bacterium]
MARTGVGYNKEKFSANSRYLQTLLFILLFFIIQIPAFAISVSANPPLTVGQTAANFHGSIDADAGSVAASFFYGKQADNLNTQTILRQFNVGNQSVSLTQFVSGLQCGTQYYYQLQVSNSVESVSSTVVNFKTNDCVSVTAQVQTLDVVDATASTARLEGNISTAGSDTYQSIQYYFEYGLDDTYGLQTPTQPLPASGSLQRNLLADVYNLACDTTYQYRLVVELTDTGDNVEVLEGNNISFTTAAC